MKKYLDEIRKLAAQQGYVETLLGRRRYFPALQGKINPQMKNREEREAINAPIQGTAADIMKIAMLKIPPALKAAGLKAKMLLQVHDELVLECPQAEMEKTAQPCAGDNGKCLSHEHSAFHRGALGQSWGEMKVQDITCHVAGRSLHINHS